MSDPKQHDEPDELDLDAETVKDLDVDSADGDDVQGGANSFNCCTIFNVASCIKPN